MSASHGSNADFIANGYVLSEYLNSATTSGQRDNAETTTFKKKSKTYIPGLKDTTMSCEGVFDGDEDAVDDVLSAALDSGDTVLISYIPEGEEVVGHKAFTMDAMESSYEITTDVGDVAQISAEFACGEFGVFGRGAVIHPMSAEASGGNGSAYDALASTDNGGGLVVHATASNNLEVKLQDSADGTTFADLTGSLTFASGRGSKRLVISGTIRQYVRVLWTGTGTFLAIAER